MASLREQILALDDMCLMKSNPDPKQSMRNCYELALISDGKPLDFKESAMEAISRAMVFRISYEFVLLQIQADILEEIGLSGGASPAVLEDIRHLTLEEAKAHYYINLALLECTMVKVHIKDVIVSWCRSGKEKSPN